MRLDLRWQRFDVKHWPGASREILVMAGKKSLEELAQRFGLGTRANASLVIRYLGLKSKPRVIRLKRPDITIELILELAATGLSRSGMARKLHASEKPSPVVSKAPASLCRSFISYLDPTSHQALSQAPSRLAQVSPN